MYNLVNVVTIFYIHLINKSEFSWITPNCLRDPKLLNGSVYMIFRSKININEVTVFGSFPVCGEIKEVTIYGSSLKVLSCSAAHWECIKIG